HRGGVRPRDPPAIISKNRAMIVLISITKSLSRIGGHIFAMALFALVPGAMSANATPALAVDAQTLQVLHAEDAGPVRYPASTTKLMAAFIVFESLRTGKVTMEPPVVLSANAMDQQFVNAGLRVGSTMTLEDALYAMIAGSANDVAVAVAETVAGSEKSFVGMMNDTAARL